MSGLPRDVLKWIQGLDLSYSVKNVKRDFSNGFLIAEIFSRYYPGDIQMHSFDTGIQTKRKIDNWEQLDKFFRKRRIPITREQAEAIIACKPDVACELVEDMYRFLTQKNVQSSRKVAKEKQAQAAARLPPFARPTTTSLINQETRTLPPDVLIPNQQQTQSLKAERIREEQKRQKALEKQQDPERYRPRPVIQRGEPKAMERIGEVPQVQFTNVSVKPVERSVAAVRLGKEQSQREMTQSRAESTAESLEGGPPRHPSAGAARAVSSFSAEQPSGPGSVGARASVGSYGGSVQHNGTTVQNIFNSIITEFVGDNDAVLRILDPQKDTCVSFVDNLARLPQNLAHDVFEAIRERKTNDLASAALSHPKEAWKLFSLVIPAFATNETSDIFGSALDLLSSIGQTMVASDSVETWEIFGEYALPALVTLIKKSPRKRYDLLRAVYFFSRNDVPTHIAVIKKLHDVLEDQRVFVSCLTMLVFMETTFTEDLLDLYIYYCVIGLSHSSAHLRASALSMLTVIAAENAAVVVQMVDKLAELATDQWWEVQAQLALCCAYLLDYVDAQSGDAERIYDVLETVFAEAGSSEVRRIALSYAAKTTQQHPALASSYVSLLLSLDEDDRQNLLGPACDVHGVSMGGHMVGSYQINRLPDSWNAAAIAHATVQLVRREGLGNMEAKHFTILSAATADLTPQNSQGWKQILLDAKEYLYVALCDADVVEQSVYVLTKLYLALFEQAFETLPTLISSLRMLFPDGPAPAQKTVNNFLITIFNSGEPWSSAMAKLVMALPDAVKQSKLSSAIDYVNSNHGKR
eukprot:TRINITY_DN40787_c0_g1_i1.p1 TRINITY_DN40787_c0_g1~~TRINITY_DN40787_c0_g1_i1.p1  ORF type:complete len:808 (-),score=180.18 TRINITY_DN40787_c0_g1_i1:98-2521(-)